jgi:hypothetical protein
MKTHTVNLLVLSPRSHLECRAGADLRVRCVCSPIFTPPEGVLRAEEVVGDALIQWMQQHLVQKRRRVRAHSRCSSRLAGKKRAIPWLILLEPRKHLLVCRAEHLLTSEFFDDHPSITLEQEQNIIDRCFERDPLGPKRVLVKKCWHCCSRGVSQGRGRRCRKLSEVGAEFCWMEMEMRLDRAHMVTLYILVENRSCIFTAAIGDCSLVALHDRWT